MWTLVLLSLFVPIQGSKFYEFPRVGLVGFETKSLFFDQKTYLEQRVVYQIDAFGDSEYPEVTRKTCSGQAEKALEQDFILKHNGQLENALNNTIMRFLDLAEGPNRKKRSLGLVFEIINIGLNLFQQYNLNSKLHDLETNVNKKLKIMHSYFSSEMEILQSKLCNEIRTNNFLTLEKLAQIHIRMVSRDVERILYSLYNNLELSSDTHSWKLSACLKVNNFQDCASLIQDQMIKSKLIAVEMRKGEIIFQVLHEIPRLHLASVTVDWFPVGIVSETKSGHILRRLHQIPSTSYKHFEINHKLCQIKNDRRYCLATAISDPDFCINALLSNSNIESQCTFTVTPIQVNCVALHLQDSTIISSAVPVQILSLENPGLTKILDPEQTHILQFNTSVSVKNCDALVSISPHFNTDIIYRYRSWFNVTKMESFEVPLKELAQKDGGDEVLSELLNSELTEKFDLTFVYIGFLSLVLGSLLTLGLIKTCKRDNPLVF